MGVRAWLAALGAGLVGLAGCAGLPDAPPGPPSTLRIAPAGGTLARLAAQAGLPEQGSAFKPLLYSGQALQARLALIEQAETGIDLQTYALADDATGRQVLRALRDAAARGVRVRLLIDDLHTVGLTELLLAMAAHDGVEVRLYNPFPAGRDSWLLRAAGLVTDFDRLNRRMHNKLLVADGRIAIVGGRNLADEYFMRSPEGNFIDFDLLCAGEVAATLGSHFDGFWNSRFAVPVQALGRPGIEPADQRAGFDRLTTPTLPPPAGVPPPQAAPGLGPLVPAAVRVFFDPPEKTAGLPPPPDRPRIVSLLGRATQSVTLLSPYFVPSEEGIERMRAATARGVRLRVVTNSLVDSDQPLVILAYQRRREALLRAGVQLFELSSERLRRHRLLGPALGTSVGRLHAKVGFADDRWLIVGSLNLDPRSANTNTELALAVDSPALVREVQALLEPASTYGVHEVQLAADGENLEWVAPGGDEVERRLAEPSPPWWQRLRWRLLSWFVADDLL